MARPQGVACGNRARSARRRDAGAGIHPRDADLQSAGRKHAVRHRRHHHCGTHHRHLPRVPVGSGSGHLRGDQLDHRYAAPARPCCDLHRTLLGLNRPAGSSGAGMLPESSDNETAPAISAQHSGREFAVWIAWAVITLSACTLLGLGQGINWWPLPPTSHNIPIPAACRATAMPGL